MANKNVKLKDGSDYLFPQTVVGNITDLTATATELNVLDGVTATTTELNYVDGVTSNIQTQLNNKPIALVNTLPTATSATPKVLFNKADQGLYVLYNDNPLTTLAGTTWRFGASANRGDIALNTVFDVVIGFSETGYTNIKLSSDYIWGWRNGGWNSVFASPDGGVTYNMQNKVITVSSGTDCTNASLIEWFVANATQTA